MNKQKRSLNFFICAMCKKEFQSKTKLRKFCNLSCTRSFLNSQNSVKDHWKRKYGEKWEIYYDLWREKISKSLVGEQNPMFGKTEHTFGLKTWAKNKTGMTLQQIHGCEFAEDISRRISFALIGEKNPAFGRIYLNGGKSIKGYYKGKFFRSLLEYSFMKHLEKQNLFDEALYENDLIKFVFNGSTRTYRIDFSIPSKKIAYEVKPSYIAVNPNEITKLKWDAAIAFYKKKGWEFCVVSENEFEKISFKNALNDQDIVFKKETFAYFRKTQ